MKILSDLLGQSDKVENTRLPTLCNLNFGRVVNRGLR